MFSRPPRLKKSAHWDMLQGPSPKGFLSKEQAAVGKEGVLCPTRDWAARARWLLPVPVTTQTTSAGPALTRSRHFTESKARPRCKARG